MSKSKVFAIVLAGALAGGAAEAGNVQWSVVIGLPVPVLVAGHASLPVFVPPLIVPRAVGHHLPMPVFHHVPVHSSGHGDCDRDGIPNRYDRVYNPRWDRDGDGIPNWRERHGRYDGHGRHVGHERHERQGGHERHGGPDGRERGEGRSSHHR